MLLNVMGTSSQQRSHLSLAVKNESASLRIDEH